MRSESIHKIDWHNGTWQNSPVGKAQIEIAFCSDWAPIRGFEQIILDEPLSVYGDLLPALQQVDLRVVNLECPLCDVGAPAFKSGAVFKGKAAHIAGLTHVPFDIVTLANNHVFDYGERGFQKTRVLLDQNHIQYLGAGNNRDEAENPLTITTNGIRLGLINFSEGEDLTAATETPGVFGWHVDRVVSLVQALKKEVHAVVVICHAGVEYIPYPPPYVTTAFQRIVEAGVSLIIGHHPHVPQGIQIHHQVPICYSLGNFVFYQPVDLLWRKLAYFVKAGFNENGITHIRLVPYEILNRNLRLLKHEKHHWFLRKLKNLSLPFADYTQIQSAWHGFLRYYGMDGFQNEIKTIMDNLHHEPAKGAAMFRNRLTTMQHNQHLADTMSRIIDGSIDTAPQWAFDRVREWMTRQISDYDSVISEPHA